MYWDTSVDLVPKKNGGYVDSKICRIISNFYLVHKSNLLSNRPSDHSFRVPRSHGPPALLRMINIITRIFLRADFRPCPWISAKGHGGKAPSCPSSCAPLLSQSRKPWMRVRWTQVHSRTDVACAVGVAIGWVGVSLARKTYHIASKKS